MVRDTEHRARSLRSVPAIGEDWVSETELYYKVKEAIPDSEVLLHASPDWLGRQHLDIFIPSLKVAIEYQGAQHEKPVDFLVVNKPSPKHNQEIQGKASSVK